MLNLTDFIATYSGKFVNPDNDPYGAQCVELANLWCINLSIEEFGGNASDFVSDLHPDCDWVVNTPAGVPTPGDIVVWGGSSALPFGHVSVFVSGDTNTFTSFDQNWPLDSACHIQSHNYTGVAGWYHPLPASTSTFNGVTAPGGVHVRVLPGTDQAVVQQPGPGDPTLVGDTAPYTFTFDAFTHHTPKGGADVAVNDYWLNTADDRWFRIKGTAHWVASGLIKGGPSTSMQPIADPAAGSAPVQAPQPKRLMYDSITASDIPVDAKIVAGYIDGKYAWSVTDWARFSGIKVRIAVSSATNDGDVLDVETGDATPEEAVAWVKLRRAAGADPSIYTNASEWAQVQAAFTAANEPRPHYWIAQWDGDITIPTGVVAKQYANPDLSGGHYDFSAVADVWPGVDVTPIKPVINPPDNPQPSGEDLSLFVRILLALLRFLGLSK